MSLFNRAATGKTCITTKSGCLSWESWTRGGRYLFWEFWINKKQCHWLSRPPRLFPNRGTASLHQASGQLRSTVGDTFYVIYLEATEARSITNRQNPDNHDILYIQYRNYDQSNRINSVLLLLKKTRLKLSLLFASPLLRRV
jgi:hypothetical protein